jgi:hypothetical protein
MSTAGTSARRTLANSLRRHLLPPVARFFERKSAAAIHLRGDFSYRLRMRWNSPLEPVSGQVGLCFPGKVISGCRDRTAITSVETECENPETKSTGANKGYLAPFPGNLCGAVSDWWSNEDSNQGPGQFYRRRATGSVRDRGRSRTRPRCSCPRLPRGRLRYVERLGRPRWRPSQP